MVNLTQYEFDTFGRQTVVIDALNNKTTTLFDSFGDVTAVIDANGHETQYQFDSLGRQTVVIDGNGNRTTTLFNTIGDVTGVIDGSGHLTQYEYDVLGRQTVMIDGASDVTTTLYDANGNATEVIDGNGHATKYVFDALNRATVTIDALNNRTTTFFDGNGNVTGMLDASANLTTFAYDADNRQIGETNANSYPSTTMYDANGNVTETINANGLKITDQYDALNRLTTQVWYDSGNNATLTLTYSFDQNGDMLTAGSSTTGTYTMSYDADGRVTVAQDMWGDVLTMAYDGVGNRTSVQDNFGGVQTSVYDAANQLVTQIFGGSGQTPLRIDQTYTGTGQIAGQTRYSDTTGTTLVATTSFTYSGADQVLNLHDKDSGGGNLANYTYSYDGAGNLHTQQRDGAAVVTYSYDATNQLSGDGSNTYSYDGSGNRSTLMGYTTGTGNELQTDGTWNYSYDKAGNEIEKIRISSGEAWTYGYDNRNELISAKDWTADPGSGGTLISDTEYKYDAFGNCVATAETIGLSMTVEHFALDGWNPHLAAGAIGTENWTNWADLDGTNTFLMRYMHGDVIGQLFSRTDAAGNAYWELQERQDSIIAVTDHTGAAKDQIYYDGYGNIIPATETNATYRGHYAYTGEFFDTTTNLQRNGVRWYDGTTGRWLQQDPLGFDAGDSNLYRYVMNRPTYATDPSGKDLVADNAQVADVIIGWMRSKNNAFGSPAINDSPELKGPIGKWPLIGGKYLIVAVDKAEVSYALETGKLGAHGQAWLEAILNNNKNTEVYDADGWYKERDYPYETMPIFAGGSGRDKMPNKGSVGSHLPEPASGPGAFLKPAENLLGNGTAPANVDLPLAGVGSLLNPDKSPALQASLAEAKKNKWPVKTASDVFIHPEVDSRILPTLQVVGGVLEAAGSAALLLAPEPTCGAKIAGYFGILHAADLTWAGLKGVWQGKTHGTMTYTETKKLAKQLGANDYAAELIAMGADVGSSLNVSYQSVKIAGSPTYQLQQAMNKKYGPAGVVNAPTTPLTRGQRLTEYFNRLRGQPASRTADEALGRVSGTLTEVEDALSGIPRSNPPPAPGMSDGRMYPPLADNIIRNPNGSISARTAGHRIEIGADGSITIRRLSGEIDFHQPGAGGGN